MRHNLINLIWSDKYMNGLGFGFRPRFFIHQGSSHFSFKSALRRRDADLDEGFLITAEIKLPWLILTMVV